jgi:hypothetical protein
MTNLDSDMSQPVIPEGQGAVETDVHEKEVPAILSVEDHEGEEKVEKRAEYIKPFIDLLFPDKPIDEYYGYVASKQKQSVDTLDNDDKGYAKRLQMDDFYTKQSVIKEIAKYQIPENQISGYINEVLALSKDTQQPGENLLGVMSRIIKQATTREHAQLYRHFVQEWSSTFIGNGDEELKEKNTQTIVDLIFKISGANIYPRPERSLAAMEEYFQSMLDVYRFIYDLPEDYDQALKSKFLQDAHALNAIWLDGDQARNLVKIYREVYQLPDKKILRLFIDACGQYASHQGLTEMKVRGLIDKLLPAMLNRDPEVSAVLEAGNRWGMGKGDFGIADFVCHAYASEVSSANINELMLVVREVPTTSVAKLEQNRLDGLTLMTPFGILRDFIHDQRPHVHEVVSGMVHYYDTGDREALEQILVKTPYLNVENSRAALFNTALYEQEVEEVATRFGEKKILVKKVKPIDVLRRLVENTKPVADNPPTTSDKELNDKLDALMDQKKTGVVLPQRVAETMEYVNNRLVEAEKSQQVGIEPSFIVALTWLEQRGFEVLRDMSYETQIGAYKLPWFETLLKFQELTSSPHKFDEQKFQAYIDQVKQLDSEAYKLIAAHTADNLQGLVQGYKAAGREDVGALWSGNINHELLGLVDLKPADTKLGARLRKERQQRLERTWQHPGD